MREVADHDRVGAQRTAARADHAKPRNPLARGPSEPAGLVPHEVEVLERERDEQEQRPARVGPARKRDDDRQRDDDEVHDPEVDHERVEPVTVGRDRERQGNALRRDDLDDASVAGPAECTRRAHRAFLAARAK